MAVRLMLPSSMAALKKGRFSAMTKPFALNELGNTYVDPDNRYVVSLIVGYNNNDVVSPAHAVATALDLTRDGDSCSTQWWVYDRHTHTLHLIEQETAEAYCES